MNPVFDKLHHICIVVHDIDKTQAYYDSIGIGPWIAYPPLVEYADLEVPNREGFLAMRYRICNMPNVQLQLCQPDHNPSPQRIHLDSKGEGVFHIGFEVPEADAAEAAAGIPVMMKGRRGNRTGFSYYDTAEGGGVVLLTRATNTPGT
ncbi:VOC family protein [Frigidibacter albus]|uniref:VOC family protein n=1 Tax=Frigidibacter albus TaxID=1465486 RepID=A0A6L8VG50_9RHOB|nr:VOC family protein [Frigidibacter albus]MZQ89295.1 VOC family protein [Frigidibacter albus]NBE31201.1 VOC family protein [Frigidibacter albus]GGH53454.1 glyoxalase [Frigidibacter albus]